MFVSDYGNHRVLIWNSIPSSDGIPADVVLGPADFASSKAGACTRTDFNSPESLWAVNGKLIVVDSNQHWVLIWNTIPVTNATLPNIVLGQQDFTHCASNDKNNDGVTDKVSA